MLFPLPLEDLDSSVGRLDALAQNVHRTYFSRYPPLVVRWGQQISRKRRRSIRLGSYNHLTCEIRIHPLLKSPQVPSFFIESVIHHEYLHHVVGANHDRRFHAAERKFRYYRESQEWIRRNLFLLLGRKRNEIRRAKSISAPVTTILPPQMALF